MEEYSKQETKLSHKEWRRIVKKERRKRKRQIMAQERDANEERLRAALENNMEYMQFCAEKEKQEKEKEVQEQEKHAERERLWLEEEVNIHILHSVLQFYISLGIFLLVSLIFFHSFVTFKILHYCIYFLSLDKKLFLYIIYFIIAYLKNLTKFLFVI